MKLMAVAALVLSFGLALTAHAQVGRCPGDQHGDGHGNCVPNDFTQDPNWGGNHPGWGKFGDGDGAVWVPPPGYRQHPRPQTYCYAKDRSGRLYRSSSVKRAIRLCAERSMHANSCRFIGCN